MNPKRKKVQEYILKHLKTMEPAGDNVKRYEKKFAAMTDAQFHKWMCDLRDHKNVLIFYAPVNKTSTRINDLITTAKNIGLKLSERLKLWDGPTNSYYLTPNEYIVLQCPVRRMGQFIDHKLSVPEGDKRVDLLSGQVMKPDQAGSLNQVEIQSLYARGLTQTITELIKYRGGDLTAFAEYKRELEEDGRTSIGRETGSVVRSAVVLDVLYSGLHVELNASGQ